VENRKFALFNIHPVEFEIRDVLPPSYIERVWFGFFLASLSEKLAVVKSWLLGKAGG
jgi:hypothetical protein